MQIIDLTDINLKIVGSIVEGIVKLSPETIFLVLTNPVDVMTYVVYKVSGLPRNRIIGQAGVLDSARYRTFIAQVLGISVNDVSALVFGVHGDAMVPLPRFTFVNGVPVEQLLAVSQLQNIIEHTRNGGAEIVNLLGDGSAYYAPAASLVQMAEAILLDKHAVLTGVAYLEEEYGYRNLTLGVPLVLGANGIERIIEVDLLAEEKEALDRSANAVELGLKNIDLNNCLHKPT